MALIEPYNANTYSPKVNINKKFKEELKGELTEEKARLTLGQFLYYNLQFTVRILMGIVLQPFQSAIMRGWFEKNFSLVCWGRGCGKSYTIGIFAVLYAIFNPGQRILIVSSNFRSSRRILENLDMIAKTKDGVLMRQCADNDLSRRNDIFQWILKNGSSIVCVPLSNGEGLRGQRANILIIDEALLVSRQIIEGVLMPFLAARGNEETTAIFKYREAEDRLIRAGKMKEEDRKQFKSKNKMILLSSASYQSEYFYEVYCNYLKKIQGIQDPKDIENPNKKEEEVSHFISQMSYEVVQELAPDILDPSILEEVNSGNIPQSIIDREYRAQFIQDSGGLFRMSKMKECSVPDGLTPSIELVGEPGAEYILGIDPNVSGSEFADHFAMTLLKIVTKPDGRKVGMLVHSYAATAVDLNDHIEYFKYLLQKFNIVYIAVDATQGDSMDFISVCNESTIFKQDKICLNAIEADFGKEDQSEIAKQIRRGYNKEAAKIVQKQYFHSAFQGAAVDHLQACIDFKNIIFAGKIQALSEGHIAGFAEADIGDIHIKHKLFNDSKDGNPVYAFIERQDYLMDLTRSELALVQVSTTPNGIRQFHIPKAYKLSKNVNRPRKDNFSSLMLANWALKLYTNMQELPPDTRRKIDFGWAA